MSDYKTTLAEFFKTIAEEKKKTPATPVVQEKIVEEKSVSMDEPLPVPEEKVSLADFFKAIAEEKKKAPVATIIPIHTEEIKEEKSSVDEYLEATDEKKTLADFFNAIAEEKRKKEGIVEEPIEEDPDSITNYVSALKGEKAFIPESLPEQLLNPEDIPVKLPEIKAEEKPKEKPVKEQEDYLSKIDLRNYVTQEDLNKHYKTFVERVQKQLSTLGGGGEKEFRFLDDIDRTTIGPNKYLSYNPSTRKFFFEQVTGVGGSGGLDSALVSQFVDSAYVQLRQSYDGGLDSALITQLIDSNYVQLRQSQILDDSYTTSLQDNVLSVINLPQNTAIGPIELLRFDTTHDHQEDFVPGTLCWDTEDQTLNLTHSNGVTQQIGQETYAFVRNSTGSTILNGTAVRFAGATQPGYLQVLDANGDAFITQDSLNFTALEATGSRLEVAPFLADGTYPSLYGLGVATQDIADSANGKVTVWGKVRGVNTSAFNIGDILYVSPTVAGGLTNVKPTAPDNVIPMAAVLRVDSSLGEIFVRPNYEQQKNYGNFVSDSDQTAVAINTPYKIRLNRNLRSQQISLTNNNSLRFAETGLYEISINAQLISSNSSSKDVYFWLRKGDSDLTGTTRRITIAGNGISRVFQTTASVSIETANTNISFMWATNDTTVQLDAISGIAFAPSAPSVQIDVIQAAL